MHSLENCGDPGAGIPGKVEFPPLILHPFNSQNPIAVSEVFGDDPELARLTARYAELRMLCLIGKDLNRWVEQCVALTSRSSETEDITETSLIELLLFHPPSAVREKLQRWGVENYPLVFSRALGLNAVFPHPPDPGQVSRAFLSNFTACADALFESRLKWNPGREATGETFDFELYASAEYTARLEDAWAVSE
jgi:hypothetical protein